MADAAQGGGGAGWAPGKGASGTGTPGAGASSGAGSMPSGYLTANPGLANPVGTDETLAATVASATAIGEALRQLEEAEREFGARAPALPFVYGTIAFWLGNKKVGSPEEHSHRWTVYVRAADGGDLTHAVKKVVFTLHPTIKDHIREVTSHPFEVTETGWGEFEIGIRICFHDDALVPVDISHVLKLHPPAGQNPIVGRPIVSEFYDELVFNEPATYPDEAAAARLLAGPGPRPPTHPFAHFHKDFSAEPDLALIAAAHAFVAQETARLSERLVRAEAELEELRPDLEMLGGTFGSHY